MALKHAQPLDAIDASPLGIRLRESKTASLLRTPAVQLMRLVLRADESVPEHKVAGAITIHCLEGTVVITTPEKAITLNGGWLVMLGGGEPHALHALADSSLLVTVLFA
jgi:quercetin dioxygenase-like cupin family protein